MIRAVSPDDAAALAEVYCDPEVMRYVAGGTLADEGAVRRLLAEYAEAQDANGFASWTVVERETGDVVGDSGFGIFEPTGDIELGYTLARRFWGRGYATEAARACLDAAFEHLAPPRVIAAVDAENHASMRVAERLGMRRSAELEAHGRPHVVFETLRA